MPTPFTLIEAYEIGDTLSHERKIYHILNKYRKNSSKEFFNLSPNEAKKIVQIYIFDNDGKVFNMNKTINKSKKSGGNTQRELSALTGKALEKRCEEVRTQSLYQAKRLIKLYKEAGGQSQLIEIKDIIAKDHPISRVRINFNDLNVRVYCNPLHHEEVHPRMPGNWFRCRHIRKRLMPCEFCKDRHGKLVYGASDRVIESKMDDDEKINKIIEWILQHDKRLE